MSEPYNWRNTLRDYASNSGVLAGFCVAFIGIALGWSLADVRLYGNFTYGNVSVFFFGIATVLFISASEFLLFSKNYDVFDYSEEYRKWLEKGLSEKNWDTIYRENNKKIKTLYKYGAHCYNCAIFMLYFGLLFIMIPYNAFVALAVFILGATFQLFQTSKSRP